MTQVILINLACLSEFAHDSDYSRMKQNSLTARPNRFIQQFLSALSECFDIVAYSTMFYESERYAVNTWLIDHEFPVENVLLRPDNDYSKSTETVFTMIETEFRNPANEIFAIVERDTRIVEALRDDGLNVLEVE